MRGEESGWGGRIVRVFPQCEASGSVKQAVEQEGRNQGGAEGLCGPVDGRHGDGMVAREGVCATVEACPPRARESLVWM
eukprot:72832-Chlamydomonas_euryale.AAC.14